MEWVADITEVPNIPSVYPNLKTEFVKIELLVPLERKELYYDITKLEPTTLEKVWYLVKQSPKIISLIFTVITFINKLKGNKMSQSMLDTIKGIIRAIFAILAGVGISSMTPEQVESIVLIFATAWGLVELILGFLSNSKIIKK